MDSYLDFRRLRWRTLSSRYDRRGCFLFYIFIHQHQWIQFLPKFCDRERNLFSPSCIFAAMDHISHTHCPVCKQPSLEHHLTCEDHLVSHRKFEIVICSICGLGVTQNVPTPEHIGAFYKSESYISHSDTKEGLINSLYHQVRSVMLRRKQRLVERYATVGSKSLLDIGCGTGYFLSHMKHQGWRVTGTEPDPDARIIAGNQLGQPILDSPEIFDLQPDSYSVITMWHVLEHVFELHDYLGQIHTLLSENGVLVIAVPNYLSYDAATYREYWAAYDVPRHLWHFTPESIHRLVQPLGFTSLHRQIMPFDPFYISMVSERYRQAQGSMVKGIIRGGVSLCRSMWNINRASSIIYVFRRNSSTPGPAT